MGLHDVQVVVVVAWLQGRLNLCRIRTEVVEPDLYRFFGSRARTESRKLQKPVSGCDLGFQAVKAEMPAAAPADGVKRAGVQRVVGDQRVATLFYDANDLLFVCLEINVAQVHVVELHTSDALELLVPSILFIRGHQLATSLEGRDESKNKRRNHVGMVPVNRRLIKFGARG